MPHLARVFQSGNSQAVRLPKEFRFNVDRVEVTQEGDALILRPHVVMMKPGHPSRRRWREVSATTSCRMYGSSRTSRTGRILARCSGDLASPRHECGHLADRPQVRPIDQADH